MKKTIEKIKDEYNFDQIKDKLDEEKMPPKLEFIFGWDNENFLNAINLTGLDDENNELVFLLYSEMIQNMMTESSLSINNKSGNIFYDNFNTSEKFYKFLLVQQDEIKQFILKCISYHHSCHWPMTYYHWLIEKHLQVPRKYH